MPQNQSADGRLDSWKEIAEYLKRDVRTAIRWGKARGLPVHRVPGGKRQAVFAYREDIDAWLGSQGQNGAAHAETSTAEGTDSNAHGASVAAGATPGLESESQAVHAAPEWVLRLNKWNLAVASAGLLALGLAASFVLTGSRTSVPVHPLNSKQLTEDGRQKSGLRTDGTTLYFNVAEGARTVLMSAPMSGSPVRAIETPFANVNLQDLSSDGKTLLVTSHEGIAHEGTLWTIPAQGGAPIAMGGALCSEARWSPDNHKIACALRTTISILDADGSNSRTIGSFSSPVGQLTWTPDGTRLRFTLYDVTPHTYSPWEIAVSQEGNATSSPVRALPTDGSCCPDWAWMKDGKTFVYVTIDADGQARLMIQTGESSHEVQLPTKVNMLSGLAPAKNALYLQIGGASRGELLKFDEKQGEFLTFLPGLSTFYLASSPDGQWMTYTNTVDNALWRSRADGSEALQLTKPPMEVQVSSWSPDGQRIAYMGRNPGEPYRIYLIGRDGGPAKQASEGNDNQGGPSWSPDGKAIVYGNVFGEETQNGWIRRIHLATGRVEIVPGSNNFRTARWSPDGKYIAALRWQTRELMLLDVRTQRWKTLADSITGDNIVWSSDSQFVYVDSPRQEKPVVERVRVHDGRRTTVASLASLQKVPAGISWVGLTPDSSPIFLHVFTASEIYELKWSDR